MSKLRQPHPSLEIELRQQNPHLPPSPLFSTAAVSPHTSSTGDGSGREQQRRRLRGSVFRRRFRSIYFDGSGSLPLVSFDNSGSLSITEENDEKNYRGNDDQCGGCGRIIYNADY